MRAPGRVTTAGALLMVAVLSVAAAARAAAPLVLVVNDLSTSSSVSPIDSATNAALSPIPVGSTPLGIAITPDARTAYVVDVGSRQLTPIDLIVSPPRARAAISLTVGPAPANARSPDAIAISPDGRLAYVSDPANAQILPIDLTTSPPRVGTPIATGPNPTGVAFTPDGRTAYVADNANTASGPGVTPITVATGHAGALIRGLGPHPFSIAIAPDGRTLYVGDSGPAAGDGDGAVHVLDLPASTVGPVIPVGGLVEGLAIAPNGTVAYAADASTVTPIDLRTRTAGAPISNATAPYAVAVTPDGRTAYFTDGALSGTTVTPLDVATGVDGTPITVGSAPRGIAIQPDQAPVARVRAAPGGRGAVTRFDASASTVQFGTIVAYRWAFGDGSAPLTTSTPVATHVYTRAGLFTATVTETDSAGTSAPASAFAGPTALGFTGATTAARADASAQGAVTFAVGNESLTAPVVGRTVVVRPSGSVLVRDRARGRFRRLRATADVPTGAEIDATHGTVTMTVAQGAAHTTSTAEVGGGRFVTTQTRGTTPITTFRLSLPLTGCAHTVRAQLARRKGPAKRAIRVREASGHFATKGHYVAASVQGTSWSTADTCTSSVVSVTSGLVRAENLLRHTKVTLGAGEHLTVTRR